MRRFTSLLLIVVIAACHSAVLPIAAKIIQQSQGAAPALTNQDVLLLVKAGMATEVIVAKLQRSSCSCDTSATELQHLKTAGVPEEVLVAMIGASRTARNELIAIRIPGGTVIDIETAYRISSQEIKAGEAISFRVVNPVKIGDAIVIAPGAIATGRVVKASRGAHFGKAGRLAWTMETVTAVDGSRVPIQSAGRIVGDSKGAKVATQMIVMGALLWPIAPVVLFHGFKRGENAYLAQGRRFEVTVSSDTTIKANGSR
jgi:hypothetical protein